MTALLRLLFVVPFAYTLAVIAAGFTIAFGAVGPAGDDVTLGVLIGALVVNTFYVGAVAFLPATIAILAAEIAALRSPLYYLSAGAFLGFAANQLGFYIGRGEQYDSRGFIYVAGGVIGAAVYWLIAGMHAGAGFVPADEES